jgi:hypothetical protein
MANLRILRDSSSEKIIFKLAMAILFLREGIIHHKKLKNLAIFLKIEIGNNSNMNKNGKKIGVKIHKIF